MCRESNFELTCHLPAAMRDGGVRRVVRPSSWATCRAQICDPIQGAHPRNPPSPYGESKPIAGKMAGGPGRAEGLQPAVLRCLNVAGADHDGELRKDHDPEPRRIRRAIASAERGEPPGVSGAEYPAVDGTAIRDDIHVTGLAGAQVRAVECLETGGASLAMNLGAGSGYTVRQVVGAVETAAGKPVAVRIAPRRQGDARELVADAALARRVFGWRGRCSCLPAIVETERRWLTRERGK